MTRLKSQLGTQDCKACDGTGKRWRAFINTKTGTAEKPHEINCQFCRGTGRAQKEEMTRH